MEDQKEVKVEQTQKESPQVEPIQKPVQPVKSVSKNNTSAPKQGFKPKRPIRKNSVDDNFEERVVKTKRISKTTKGGRRMRFSALVIVGDKDSRVGYGIGKATEVPNAIKKAVKNARKNIVKIPMTKSHTLYHEIIGHKGATRVLIKPAAEGTGIIAGGVIRDVIELAGFHDVYTKNLGSNTALNMVIACVDGLKNQFIPHKVREVRGISSKNNSQTKEQKELNNGIK